MRVCFFFSLFWLAHLSTIFTLINGADREEGYKPRRWTAAGDGPYRLVVSSEAETLAGEESVSLALASERKKKEKGTEDDLMDKVTQRMALKQQRGRKRHGSDVNPSRRRNTPVAVSTTGSPQTMSYNLYNHFRPLEQDLPRDSILPFLDFGRKLSTPSGANSIESSSTPRGVPPSPDPPDEDVFTEEMDVSVIPKAVERNTAPRGPVQPKHNIAAAFYRRNITQLHPVPSNRTAELYNSTSYDNKTDAKNVHYDLQSNESGINLHAVLSPNYGLKLNKSDANSTDEHSTENSILNHDLKVQPGDNSTNTVKPSELIEVIYEGPKSNVSLMPLGEVANDTQLVEAQVPVPSPKPTARILSTAVVTSVSVKESSWQPRIKSNFTRPEIYQRLSPKNLSNDLNASSLVPPEIRFRSDNLTLLMQSNIRRKMYTTLKPKTTTYRPVTFRSVLRRNFTGFGSGVVHIYSTPPTYIEVPKILSNVPVRKLSHESLVSAVNTSETSRSSTTISTSKAPELIRGTVLSAQVESKSYQNDDVALPTEVPLTTVDTLPSSTQAASPATTSRTESPSSFSSPSLTLATAPSATTLSSSTTSSSTRTSSTTTTLPTTTTSTTPSTTSVEPSETPSLTSTSMSPDTDRIPTAFANSDITSPPQETTELINKNPEEDVTAIPPVKSSSSLDIENPKSDNASVQIEFKPLDVRPISTTESTYRNASRRPGLMWIYNPRNHSVVRTQPVAAYPDSHLGLVTYVLAGLALVPLILGLSVLARQIFKKSKKKVLDESEYSSEYNRTPLPTKLPRVPAHINWEGEKPAAVTQTAPVIPATKWEFSRDKLRLQTVLGQGNFGQVWKAEADDLSGHEGSTRLVAVKTVKEGSTPREKEDLLRELAIMQELGSHPNVVQLLGCCTEKEPYLLIMEYVMYGKLLAFLREHRTRAHYFNFSDLSSALTSRDLTFFSYCVAKGMEYLVTKGIIHRDLAARNILVDHTKLCKIADFGMSRNVRDTGQIYEQKPSRGALPIRWMAPESLHLSVFTHKSDVWSFGILLWEIVTLGSTPYNKLGAREVMRQVRDGYRLERPKHCRPEFYRVMRKCWASDPGARPSFTELKQDLAALLNDEKTNGEYVDLEALTEEMCDQGT